MKDVPSRSTSSPAPGAAASASSTALLTDGAVVRRILEHLGLPTTAPTLAPARAPPEPEFDG